MSFLFWLKVVRKMKKTLFSWRRVFETLYDIALVILWVTSFMCCGYMFCVWLGVW